MKYGANSSWEIEGLDVPMIPVHLIPKGYCQEWKEGLWRLTKERGTRYLKRPAISLCTDNPHFCNHFYDGKNGWLYENPFTNQQEIETMLP
jgi:hypothetical protein